MVIELDADLDATATEKGTPWLANASACNTARQVWCVQD